MWRSEPHTPLASTRTIASSGEPSSGSGTSSTRTSPGPWKVTARIARHSTGSSRGPANTRHKLGRPHSGGEDEHSPRSRPDHRLLERHRPRDRRPAGREGLDRVRDRPPARLDRRPRRSGLSDTRPRRHRRGFDAGGGRRGRGVRGRGRSAGQQRRLQPVGGARDAADGEAAGAVRDQRVRARAHVPAGAAEDARGGARADRQPELDGRQAHLPRRRRLPRDQVRGRGALRRAALGGARVRGPGGDRRAGPDHDPVRRDGRRLARRRRAGRGLGRRSVRGVQRGGRGRDGRRLRGSDGAARRRAGGGREGDRAGPELAQPAAALQGHRVRPAGDRRNGRCSRTGPGMRSCEASFRRPGPPVNKSSVSLNNPPPTRFASWRSRAKCGCLPSATSTGELRSRAKIAGR